MSGFVSLADELVEEEEVEEVSIFSKEEHEVAVACSWMQAGGSNIGRRGGAGVVA